jgi:hypothetical protein
MKKSIVVGMILFISACSSLSKNFVQEGSLRVKGGVSRSIEWRDVLVFKRLSWYKELTLLFDLAIAKVDKDSHFTKWFSASELETISKCSEAYVGVTYALDNKKISIPMFQAELKGAGFTEYPVPDFEKELRLHPDFEVLSLQLYRVSVLCRSGETLGTGPLLLRFPGFNQVSIDLN